MGCATFGLVPLRMSSTCSSWYSLQPQAQAEDVMNYLTELVYTGLEDSKCLLGPLPSSFLLFGAPSSAGPLRDKRWVGDRGMDDWIELEGVGVGIFLNT